MGKLGEGTHLEKDLLYLHQSDNPPQTLVLASSSKDHL